MRASALWFMVLGAVSYGPCIVAHAKECGATRVSSPAVAPTVGRRGEGAGEF